MNYWWIAFRGIYIEVVILMVWLIVLLLSIAGYNSVNWSLQDNRLFRKDKGLTHSTRKEFKGIFCKFKCAVAMVVLRAIAPSLWPHWHTDLIFWEMLVPPHPCLVSTFILKLLTYYMPISTVWNLLHLQCINFRKSS